MEGPDTIQPSGSAHEPLPITSVVGLFSSLHLSTNKARQFNFLYQHQQLNS